MVDAIVTKEADAGPFSGSSFCFAAVAATVLSSATETTAEAVADVVSAATASAYG